MSRERATIGHALTAGLFIGLETLLRILPLDLTAPALRLLGRLAWMLDGRHRRIAEEHLRAAFGDALPPRDRRRIARGVFEHLAVCFAEYAHADRIYAGPAWREHIEVTGLEVLEALPPGSPVLWTSGHLGNWEVAALALSRLGRRVVAIDRPLDNPILYRHLLKRRERFGHRMLAKWGAMRIARQVLLEGGEVGMLADQNVRRDPVFVDFFGIPAATVKSIGRLARDTGATVITGFTHRIPGSHRHRFTIDPPLTWIPAEDPEEDIRRITQAYTDRVQMAIRRTPEQYLWFHRRWRTRPGQEEPARRPAPAEEPVKEATP